MSPADVSAAYRSERPDRAHRFWNWKLMAIEAVVAGVGFSVLNATTVKSPALQGVLGALVCVVALYLLLREFGGTRVDAKSISMPAQRVPWFPVIAFGRRTIALEEVQRISVGMGWGGFQVVRITGAFGVDILVFQSRSQRRRFVKFLVLMRPALPVYRSRSLPEV